MKIILHCGLHKTGTTSLQKLLFENYSTPVRDRPFYPTPKKKGPGHANSIKNLSNPDSITLEDNIDSYLKIAVDFGVSHLIISSETIYTLPVPLLEKLLSKLKKYADDISYVITLSPYYSRYISCYSEMVKNGWRRSFEESFDSVIKRNTLNNELIFNFLEFLGKSKVFLFINPPNFINSEIGINFSRYLNLDPILPELIAPVNVTFSRFQVEFWRLCNTSGKDDIVGLKYSNLQKDIQHLFKESKWKEVLQHMPDSKYTIFEEWKPKLIELANEHFIIFNNSVKKYNYIVCGNIENLNYIDENL